MIAETRDTIAEWLEKYQALKRRSFYWGAGLTALETLSVIVVTSGLAALAANGLSQSSSGESGKAGPWMTDRDVDYHSDNSGMYRTTFSMRKVGDSGYDALAQTRRVA
jgi:hypothetical protein